MAARAPEPPLDPPDVLEGGLRVAFGPPDPPATIAGSVLARLELTGVDASHVVLLRDEPSNGEPLVNPQLAPAQGRAEGRYQVLGEIARGGVGVVLKGRDVDLGRDVAMKVLRDEHAKNPDVLRRFVEEAQIGGQLQHPGIVPVYEMGVRADRRPYFTMKLIKGRTLAALLAERTDPTHDVRRFLALFESVCQTVAYAHSRGVVHRDLKPANVMVGAFGEVLVVDWGMGKVLTSGGVADERRAKRSAEAEAVVATVRSEGTGSESVAGSVMGTPRYMAPEQARGAIEQLDERADVFALGAILCEILTGRPPYLGSPHVVLSQAARGDVEEALQRLAAADVEADLAALVRACLARDLAARPRDAGVVAKAVGAHLASVEERAAAARTEAAESRVKAAEERKRRRLSLALSGAVLGLVLLGGGGWLYFEQDRRTRVEQASREVGQVLDESMALQANAAAGDDVGRWKEALAAARRAESLARSSGADAATRVRAARAVSDLDRGHEAARRRADERARDGEMAARLESVQQRLPYREFEAGDTEQELERAFKDYGIDPEKGDLAALAVRIRTSPIADPLLTGLDAWTAQRRLAGRSTETWLRLLDDADADPWRTKLRAATTLEASRALVSATDVDALPRRSLSMLCPQLSRLGDPETAYALAKRAQSRDPGDRTVLLLAAVHAGGCRPPHAEDAVRFATAALALLPESAEGHALLGLTLRSKGDLRGAALAVREAVRWKPESAWSHELLGSVLSEMGEHDEAAREGRKSVRGEQATASAYSNLGETLRRSGDLDGAILQFHEAIRRNPGFFEAHINLARALEAKGDFPASAAAFRVAAGLGVGSVEARYATGCALMLSGDTAAALVELREAVHLRPDWPVALGRLGYALCLAGDYGDAIAALTERIRIGPPSDVAHYLLGSAHAQQGAHERALVQYREALRLNPHYVKALHNLAASLTGIGDFEGSVAAFRDTVREAPSSAPSHLGLGQALIFAGEFRSAAEAVREAIRLKADLEGAAEALQRAERFAVLEGRLDGVLSGKDMVSGASERVELASVAFFTSRYAAAAALYTGALFDDPGLAAEHGYRAASAAARAGAGQGKDATTLSEADRAGWRRQALARLRTVLERIVPWAEMDDPATRLSMVRQLEHMRVDRNLAGVREPTRIADLPPDERGPWRAFWMDVDVALVKARAAR